MKISLISIFIVFLIVNSSFGDDKKIEVGIDEQLGKYISLDAQFKNELNEVVQFKDLLGKPVVLAFVYYQCPSICNPLMLEIADVVNKVDLNLGADYRIICISINDDETSAIANSKKNNFLGMIDHKVNSNAWVFLTGDSTNILKCTQSAGFYFKRDGENFAHTSSLIFLSPGGKICRYIFPDYSDSRGFGILPFDFKMALMEASDGRVGTTIARVLQYCFSYSPEGQTYVLNLTRIFGAVIILFAGVFIFFVIKLKPKKLKPRIT